MRRGSNPLAAKLFFSQFDESPLCKRVIAKFGGLLEVRSSNPIGCYFFKKKITIKKQGGIEGFPARTHQVVRGRVESRLFTGQGTIESLEVCWDQRPYETLQAEVSETVASDACT